METGKSRDKSKQVKEREYMPIYEYECQQCGAVSEYLVGVGYDDSVECKECGSSEGGACRRD
jgi:putative FmdB family regulatory protein